MRTKNCGKNTTKGTIGKNTTKGCGRTSGKTSKPDKVTDYK